MLTIAACDVEDLSKIKYRKWYERELIANFHNRVLRYRITGTYNPFVLLLSIFYYILNVAAEKTKNEYVSGASNKTVGGTPM